MTLSDLINAELIDATHSSTIEGEWHILLDVAAFPSAEAATSSIRKVAGPENDWVNLYGDMDGLELAALGPRLLPLTNDTTEIERFLISPDISRGISLLRTTSTTSDFISHLLSLRELKMPDNSMALFRFQDSRVVTALSPQLSPEQVAGMLGPAVVWLCVDPCENIFAISQVGVVKRGGTFGVTPEQLIAVDAALLPYEILAQTNEADSAVLKNMDSCMQLTSARRLISEAHDRGLRSPSDVSLYCVLGFQLPEGFAEQQPFSDAIRGAAEGKFSLSRGLDVADQRDWIKWNEQLAEQDRCLSNK